MKLTDAELTAIRASDARDQARVFEHYAQKDRRALLAHIEALETELTDWGRRVEYDVARIAELEVEDRLRSEKLTARIAELEAALKDPSKIARIWWSMNVTPYSNSWDFLPGDNKYANLVLALQALAAAPTEGAES